MAMLVDVKTFSPALARLALFNHGSCDRDSKLVIRTLPLRGSVLNEDARQLLPPHHFQSMLGQGFLVQWFCEHVRWLVRRADWEDVHRAACNVHSEVVVLDIYVLGARSHRWRLGQDQSSRVVLEQCTFDDWLDRFQWLSVLLYLVYQSHDRNRPSKRLTQSDVLGFRCAECYFSCSCNFAVMTQFMKKMRYPDRDLAVSEFPSDSSGFRLPLKSASV